ncbi:MAG TPA: hypothetical protein VGQ96_02140 [Candidatus Eremiobacteraceae bacterium]|nr:hypothetical protein [Candidatus Eremiobacteraceae bacterium]
MMRHKIPYASMAASFGFVAMTAAAQTTAPVQNDNVDAAPANHSIVAPAPGGTQSSTIAPMNIMEDVPRDMSGKPARTGCDNDPASGPAPAACRRWMEIARTL